MFRTNEILEAVSKARLRKGQTKRDKAPQGPWWGPATPCPAWKREAVLSTRETASSTPTGSTRKGSSGQEATFQRPNGRVGVGGSSSPYTKARTRGPFKSTREPWPPSRMTIPGASPSHLPRLEPLLDRGAFWRSMIHLLQILRPFSRRPRSHVVGSLRHRLLLDNSGRIHTVPYGRVDHGGPHPGTRCHCWPQDPFRAWIKEPRGGAGEGWRVSL